MSPALLQPLAGVAPGTDEREIWRRTNDLKTCHWPCPAKPGELLSPRRGPVLSTLRGARYRLGVVSTKYRHRVEVALERDGLRVFVEVVVASNDVPRPKPAPDGLLRLAGALGTATGDCVIVGDSEVDVKAAHDARMGFIAVLTGTTPAETFAGYAPPAVFADVGEIVPG